MRTYPVDSPEAKARIIGLALLADSGVDKSELELLDNQAIVSGLGIAAATFETVMYELYQDIELSGLRGPNGQLELAKPAIESLLDEIQRPTDRHALVRAIIDITHADNDLSLGEIQLTSLAMRRWKITHQQLKQASRTRLSGLPPAVRNLVAEACS